MSRESDTDARMFAILRQRASGVAADAMHTQGTLADDVQPITYMVTRHELHEAVYHSVTLHRPSGMTKTKAHQLASRVAEETLAAIVRNQP
jgi:hypothetical protein